MSKMQREDCSTLSIYRLNSWGCLSDSYSSGTVRWTNSWTGSQSAIGYTIDLTNEYIHLDYVVTSFSGEKTEVSHKYPLVSLPCNYGGKRWFFECSAYLNGIYCGNRVANLYKRSGCDIFACRHCCNLTYRSRIDPGGSLCELDEYEDKIKRWYYKGKPTKKHLQYLKKEEALCRAITRII